MTLSELVRLLEQHGVNLTLTAEGKLKPTADQQPPAEVIEGIRQHRAALVRRLERGQRADGRYHLADLLPLPGICASCARWQPFTAGDLLGRCPLVDGLGIHAAHRCPPEVNAWKPAPGMVEGAA